MAVGVANNSIGRAGHEQSGGDNLGLPEKKSFLGWFIRRLEGQADTMEGIKAAQDFWSQLTGPSAQSLNANPTNPTAQRNQPQEVQNQNQHSDPQSPEHELTRGQQYHNAKNVVKSSLGELFRNLGLSLAASGLAGVIGVGATQVLSGLAIMTLAGPYLPIILMAAVAAISLYYLSKAGFADSGAHMSAYNKDQIAGHGASYFKTLLDKIKKGEKIGTPKTYLDEGEINLVGGRFLMGLRKGLHYGKLALAGSSLLVAAGIMAGVVPLAVTSLPILVLVAASLPAFSLVGGIWGYATADGRYPSKLDIKVDKAARKKRGDDPGARSPDEAFLAGVFSAAREIKDSANANQEVKEAVGRIMDSFREIKPVAALVRTLYDAETVTQPN